MSNHTEEDLYLYFLLSFIEKLKLYNVTSKKKCYLFRPGPRTFVFTEYPLKYLNYLYVL